MIGPVSTMGQKPVGSPGLFRHPTERNAGPGGEKPVFFNQLCFMIGPGPRAWEMVVIRTMGQQEPTYSDTGDT
jgi:hypothetical protein